MSSEFKREERYVVIKIKDLEFNSPSGDKNKRSKELGEWISRNSLRTRECVVVESDWPEYHLVWAMIEHRIAGKPVPNFNDWRRADELQQRLTAADERVDVLEGLLRLARGAIGENQWTLLTKDIDAMLSRDAKRTNNSGNAHCPHDGICHTSDETCAEAVVRVESIKPTTCAWQYGAFSWRTSCGEEWMLNDGTPEQNGMKFCHSCGKTLVVEGEPA